MMGTSVHDPPPAPYHLTYVPVNKILGDYDGRRAEWHRQCFIQTSLYLPFSPIMGDTSFLQTWRFSLRQGLTVLKHESIYFKKGLPAELKCKPTTFGKKRPISCSGHLVGFQDLSAGWPFLLFHSKASWKSQYRETKEKGKSLPKKGH